MEKLNIYGMSLNQNKVLILFIKTLITLATDRGYRIIETFKFSTVSEGNDILDLIVIDIIEQGPLQISTTYYESNIILFVGTEDNLNFPPNQIALWDDSKRKKIGLIMLKTNVIDLKLTKKNLFVFVNNKVILFDFMTLEYITSINDVTSDNKLISISTKINPIILAYMDSKSRRKINIIRCNFIKMLVFSNVENSRIIGKIHKFITSKFENSQYIKLSKTVFIFINFWENLLLKYLGMDVESICTAFLISR